MDDETVAFFLQDRGGRLQQGDVYQALGEDGMELNTDAGDCPLARVLLNLWLGPAVGTKSAVDCKCVETEWSVEW